MEKRQFQVQDKNSVGELVFTQVPDFPVHNNFCKMQEVLPGQSLNFTVEDV
jgi:hypothetical protein